MTAAAHPAPERHEVGLVALWFGLFGAPAAWTVHELVAYAVAAHACYPSAEPKLSVAMPRVSTIVMVVTLLMLLVALLAALVAARSWKRSREEGAPEAHHPLEHGEGRTRFMALSGFVVSLIFTFNIVMDVIVVLMEPACS
jgi:hypothetical protein